MESKMVTSGITQQVVHEKGRKEIISQEKSYKKHKERKTFKLSLNSRLNGVTW